MRIMRTPSFELAINTRGVENAQKVALILPGRLDTKDYACFDSHIEHLANQGYFSVSFDPPGTWDSPGGIELFTTSNYIKAVHELIEYFGNKPTLLFGHSRGGLVAIIAGTLNPAVIGIVVVMASYGVPSSPSQNALRKGVDLSYRDLPPGTQQTTIQKEFALPLSYFKDGEQYNVVEVLKSCVKPKLLLYGDNDEFTRPETVNEVFDQIPMPKMLHQLRRDHNYRYYPEIVQEVNSVMGNFLIEVYGHRS